MTTFVGIEYVIGNSFIYLTEERFITLKALYEYCEKLQAYWNSNSIDALISGEVISTLYNFYDYFEFSEKAGIILLKPEISDQILKQRFIGYLPINILLSFKEVAKELS